MNRRLFLGVACSLSILLLGCISEGAVITSPTPEPKDKQATEAECADILGAAFASAEQRQWFLENCSSWPQLNLPQSPPRRVQESPECAALRGRPYENQEQRRWFLANCVGGSQQVSVSSAGDRTSCDEIRGTPYRSGSEREWYLANCSGPLVTEGPDRTNCDEIRGTAYRSENERTFYLANCLSVGNQIIVERIEVGGGNRGRGRGGDRDDDD